MRRALRDQYTGLCWGGPDHGNVRTHNHNEFWFNEGSPGITARAFGLTHQLSKRQETIRKLWALPKYPESELIYSPPRIHRYRYQEIAGGRWVYSIWMYEEYKPQPNDEQAIVSYINARVDITRSVCNPLPVPSHHCYGLDLIRGR